MEILGFCNQKVSEIKRRLSRLVSSILDLVNVTQPSGFSKNINQLERKMKSVFSAYDCIPYLFINCIKHCLVLLSL